MGESAGSWCILHHMLSPLSQGLFIGGIAQSGTPLGDLNYRYRTQEEDEYWGAQ